MKRPRRKLLEAEIPSADADSIGSIEPDPAIPPAAVPDPEPTLTPEEFARARAQRARRANPDNHDLPESWPENYSIEGRTRHKRGTTFVQQDGQGPLLTPRQAAQIARCTAQNIYGALHNGYRVNGIRFVRAILQEDAA